MDTHKQNVNHGGYCTISLYIIIVTRLMIYYYTCTVYSHRVPIRNRSVSAYNTITTVYAYIFTHARVREPHDRCTIVFIPAHFPMNLFRLNLNPNDEDNIMS